MRSWHPSQSVPPQEDCSEVLTPSQTPCRGYSGNRALGSVGTAVGWKAKAPAWSPALNLSLQEKRVWLCIVYFILWVSKRVSQSRMLDLRLVGSAVRSRRLCESSGGSCWALISWLSYTVAMACLAKFQTTERGSQFTGEVQSGILRLNLPKTRGKSGGDEKWKVS